MADNGYLAGLPGCGLGVSGALISSGGCIVTAPAPRGLDADIILSSGGGITVNTTFPNDLSSAYQDFVSAKQGAIYSGGDCVYAGNSQTFTAGSSYSAIAQHSLMTLNGVAGSLEAGEPGHTYKSNINFLPTVGFWVETDQLTNGKVASVFRILQDCVSCQDYNDLFVMEMILYHAINKIAWRLMRPEGTYVPGTWQQYQGALYRWNANTYSAQYVYSLDKSEDTFVVKLGWINTTCTGNTSFVAYANVNYSLNPGETASPYIRYQLMYGGSPATHSAGTVTAFIANTGVSKIYYLEGDSTTGGGALPVFSYTEATSIQDFNDPANVGGWVVGIVCSGMSGDGYGACAFQLGYAQSIENNVEVVNDPKWQYQVTPHWSTNINGSTDGYDGPTDTVYVNGLAVPE